MEYKINLGAWSSVFAVPCDVVDKHIKLAGAAQLKVLLWVLRNSDKGFTVEDISADLGMHSADVKDSMQFWETAGLICINNMEISPASTATKQAINEEVHNTTINTTVPTEAKPQRALLRPLRPDSLFVAQRMNEDDNIASLMQEAELILGRPLSGGDTSTLLMLHDNDGLPVAVILMLLQFAMGEGKANMRYIEKVGVSWATDEVFTIERAEEKIEEINKKKNAWELVKRTFGLNTAGSPTKIQIEYSNRWINEYSLPTDLIREAYEICINTKGQYNIKYIDGIIKKWYTEGLKTLADVKKYQEIATTGSKAKQQPTNNKKEQWQNKSFDLKDIEGKDIFSDN